MSWSMFVFNDLLEVVVPVIGAVVAWRWWMRLGGKSVAAYYTVRFVVIALMLTFVSDCGSIDLDGWYMHAGWMADRGLMPQRDFHSPYHLGFNALICAAVRIWHSPLAIVLLYTVAEGLAVALLYPVLRFAGSECLAKRTLILFASSPVCVLAARSTQDEPLCLLGAAAIAWAAVRSRRVWFVAATFLSVSCTKIFAGLYVAAFVGMRRWKGVLCLVGVFAVYWGVALMLGVHPLDCTFGREIGLDAPSDQIMESTTKGNVWCFFGPVPNGVRYGVLLSVLAGVGLWFRPALFDASDRRRQLCVAMRLAAVWYLFFDVLSPMSFFMYMLPALPFVLAVLLLDESRLGRAVLGAFLLWTVPFGFKDAQSSIILRCGVFFDLVTVGGALAFAGILAAGLRHQKELK